MKILEKQGFALNRVRGSHHVYYNEISKKRIIVPPTLFI
ncbi:type II toxin-antitoxin system HicA family toxin [Petrotoga sp. DB-2]